MANQKAIGRQAETTFSDNDSDRPGAIPVMGPSAGLPSYESIVVREGNDAALAEVQIPEAVIVDGYEERVAQQVAAALEQERKSATEAQVVHTIMGLSTKLWIAAILCLCIADRTSRCFFRKQR